uniref:Uncharacterized protein n=1 Tax=Rhizophora mucronata TaxID=61149 RepID=A0A2P2QP56_RHIMU
MYVMNRKNKKRRLSVASQISSGIANQCHIKVHSTLLKYRSTTCPTCKWGEPIPTWCKMTSKF